jgi:hypothetical protein
MVSNNIETADQARHRAQPAAGMLGAQASAWVALFLLAVYLLITGGETFISDGELMLLTAVRLADEQTLTLPETAAAFPQTVRGQGGFLFSRYGVGQPMAAGVLYLVGTYGVGMGLLPGSAAYQVGRFMALLLPALATALTGGLLCGWAAQLYRSLRLGVLIALLYGLGTLALPYSRFFFSEPLFTCCLLLAAFALYQRWPLLAGLALGYALATRLSGVFVLPAFVAYAWLCGYRLRGLLWAGAGVVPGLLLIMLNNWVRFRSLYEYGYGNEGFTGNLLEGLAGLLLSPGKSLFLYVPLLLVLPFAVLPFARRWPAEAVLVAGLTLLTLLHSGLWWIWWGGWGWGPRFLVPLMPFLVLVAGVLLEQRGWRAAMLYLLFPLSLAVNLLGIMVDFNKYLSEITRGDMAREQIYLWQPAYSPLVAHIQRLDMQDMPIVSFALSRPDIGFSEPAATLISAGMVLLLVGALAGLWHTLRQDARLNNH